MGIFSGPDDVIKELRHFAAEWNDLGIESSERIARMKQYRLELGQSREVGMRDRNASTNGRGDSDYGRRGVTHEPQRHHIPVPIGRALTVKHAYRISGHLPDVIVDRREESPQERYRSDTMEKIVWSILHASGGETSLSSGAWDASEIGAACFDLYYDIEREMPLMRRVDPAGILTVNGIDDPHDFERVYRSWDVPLRSLQAQYADKVFRAGPVDIGSISPTFTQGNVPMVTVVQMGDKRRTIRFAAGGNTTVGLYQYDHNLGFAPYVVIPNIGPYEDVWGWSDYEFVRSVTHYIEALFSREADVIRQIANGAVIEKGTGQNPQAILKAMRDGGVIPSKRDGAVEPVAAPEMPSFHETHSIRAMEFLKMVGFAPDAAWGLPYRSTSGTDRGLQLQPLMEYTAMKQLNWAKGLSRLFSMAFQMIEKKMVTTVSYRGSVHKTGGRRDAFNIILGPDAEPDQYSGDETDPTTGMPVVYSFPRSPKDLFDGDYCCRFQWNQRIDPEDPSFVTSELARFTQGAQSLETTLERLGFQAPEDEMRRIEQEAERFPWINNGLVQLIKQQIAGGNRQGQGGGNPGDTPADQSGDASAMMQGDGGGQSGALDQDAMGKMLPGSPGTHYGGA